MCIRDEARRSPRCLLFFSLWSNNLGKAWAISKKPIINKVNRCEERSRWCLRVWCSTAVKSLPRIPANRWVHTHTHMHTQTPKDMWIQVFILAEYQCEWQCTINVNQPGNKWNCVNFDECPLNWKLCWLFPGWAFGLCTGAITDLQITVCKFSFVLAESSGPVMAAGLVCVLIL